MSVGTPPAGDRDLLLLRLRHREGQLTSVAGNQPVLLTDPDSVWVVVGGQVEVFVVRVEAGRPAGPRRHLFGAATGDALFGIKPGDGRLGLLASGRPGTQLVLLSRSRLVSLASSPEVAPLVAPMLAGWIGALGDACSSLAPDRLPVDQ